MRELARRHLGKLVATVALAVTGAAVAVGASLPDDTGGAGDAARAGASQQDAVAPAGKVEAAPAEGEKGVGRDPLTDAEIDRAGQLAVANNNLRRNARDVEGDRGPQHLSTNLTEIDPGLTGAGAAQRRADVVSYDYKSDSVVTKTVNLDTGKVEDTRTDQGVQPPPSQAELAEAAQLLIADRLGADLKSDYKDATGKQLTDAGQLQVSGMVFRKETVVKVPVGLTDCGKHRCLRVVAKVKSGPWIDTRALVVDLSERTVGRLS
ncbi:Tat pathway signal sequence domain protein [Streptomyces kunmingensis]|uniref:Tat pathway signal sequence domain protein n=1 Tax=Streptomyces kunmingensis TaxID=68225 RepID=A0ABU6CCW2_9ACTN|nr:Tat pathway signal sequence domain protein [Streptomyces kunmingensis]MEB3962299.1 Tat pathway signal sequence domain protein [Streptomyces kunmingensis]